MNEDKRRKAEKRKSHNAEKQLTGRRVFDEFVNLFFIRGSPGDWIPTSSNSGPLVTLANRLCRPTYLPSQEERSKALFRAHNFGNHDGEKVTKRVTTRAANAGDVRFSSITGYVGRRLPLYANYTAEIEPIHDWINEICAKGYSRFINSQDAFAVCLSVINSYVIVDGKRAYKGYPKPKKAPSSPRSILPLASQNDSCDTSNAPPAPQNDRTPANTTLEPTTAICNDLSGESRTGAEENLVVASSDDATPSRDSSIQNQAKYVLEIAHDDEAFVLLCLLFDNEAENFVISCAGARLEKDSSLQKTDSLMKEFLLYAHRKVFGIKDEADHQFREEGLRCMMNLAAKARAVYGLAPYSLIRHKYFSFDEE